MVEKLVLDRFLKNQNCAYLWINSLKFYAVCFYCMSSWGLSKYIETKFQTTCFYPILTFLKSKKSLELIFEKKYFSSYILLIDISNNIVLSFIVRLPLLYFLGYWAISILQFFVNQVVTSWISKLTLSFWWSRFSCMTKKSWQKLKYFENEKGF